MELNFNFMGMGVRIGGRELPVFFAEVSTQINQGGGIIFWLDPPHYNLSCASLESVLHPKTAPPCKNPCHSTSFNLLSPLPTFFIGGPGPPRTGATLDFKLEQQ